jgi:ATP-dependent DNA helicase RecQ
LYLIDSQTLYNDQLFIIVKRDENMRDLADKIFKPYLPDAELKNDQWNAIILLLDNKRTMVIQPTGWGKSVVYFVAAKLFRQQGKGVTVIVSPLLALIRNQLDAASKIGLNTFTLNSENIQEWNEVNKAIANNDCDLLIVAPERLHRNTVE